MSEHFELDPAHTVIGFSVTHLGVTAVRGSFARFSGTFQADRSRLALATGEVVVETATLTTGAEERDAHLRSPDFFDVEHFPRMTFRLTGVRYLSGDDYEVMGDLTIRDVTRPIRLLATYHGETANPFGSGNRIGVSATGQLDRTAFGLNWNQMAGTVRVVALPVTLHIDAEVVAVPDEREAASSIDSLLGQLSPRELAALRKALDRVTAEVDSRIGEAPPATATPPPPVPQPQPQPRRGLFGRRRR